MVPHWCVVACSISAAPGLISVLDSIHYTYAPQSSERADYARKGRCARSYVSLSRIEDTSIPRKRSRSVAMGKTPI